MSETHSCVLGMNNEKVVATLVLLCDQYALGSFEISRVDHSDEKTFRWYTRRLVSDYD